MVAVGAAGLVEHAVDAVVDDVEDAAGAERDHRRAAGQGLDRRDAEVLDAGLEQADGPAVEVAQLLVADAAQQAGAPGGERLRGAQRSGPSPTTRSSRPSGAQAAIASSTRLYGASAATIRA